MPNTKRDRRQRLSRRSLRRPTSGCVMLGFPTQQRPTTPDALDEQPPGQNLGLTIQVTPNTDPLAPLPSGYKWPRGITVGHVLLDIPPPYHLPAHDPGLVFPHPFPPIPSASARPTIYPMMRSPEGSLWHPGINCGWFPVTLVYQGLVPLSGRAWVHLWPTSEEPPAKFVPPSFDKFAIDFRTTPELYFGRFYVYTPHALP